MFIRLKDRWTCTSNSTDLCLKSSKTFTHAHLWQQKWGNINHNSPLKRRWFHSFLLWLCVSRVSLHIQRCTVLNTGMASMICFSVFIVKRMHFTVKREWWSKENEENPEVMRAHDHNKIPRENKVLPIGINVWVHVKTVIWNFCTFGFLQQQFPRQGTIPHIHL